MAVIHARRYKSAELAPDVSPEPKRARRSSGGPSTVPVWSKLQDLARGFNHPLERSADEHAAAVVSQKPGPDMAATPRSISPSPVLPAGAPESIAHLASRGQPLLANDRAFFEARFGSTLDHVRLHTYPEAASLAEAADARAFTIGGHVFFADGEYAPSTAEGRMLLAHELVHHLQDPPGIHPQARRESRPRPAAREGAGAERTSRDYRRISMTFDGRDLVVRGDGAELHRYSAQSGRPILLSEEDANACGADARIDTYMNDPRFVGIKDKGPIPEGSYTLQPAGIERIEPGLLGVGRETTAGAPIHPGDWGTGRVALTRRGRLREGPCGNANARSGFFLHGGILSGSSGCIDIGSGFDEVAAFFEGDRRPVVVTVSYDHPSPAVGFATGLSGALAYGAFDLQQRPAISFGAETGAGGTRWVASLSHQVLAAFAGGSLSLEPRLDIPFDSRDAFVRGALTIGANFRVLQALYGRLRLGANLPLRLGPSVAFEAGAGLGYDFGQVQLEAMYDLLNPASADERVHRVMVGVGFRFGAR